MPESSQDQCPLRIDHLVLENYRCFARLDVTFHPRLTVVVARNGCGKTAVLDALAVALGPFVGAFDPGCIVRFRPSDVRQIPRPGMIVKESEPQYPLTEQATGLVDSHARKWVQTLNSPNSSKTYKEAKTLIEFGERLQRVVRDVAAEKAANMDLPLVSYYGTGRLWNEKRLTRRKKTSSQTSRTAGYMDCLDSASHYKVFVDWFERLCRAEYEERDNPEALNEINGKLSAVRNAVDCMLKPSGWHHIAFKSTQAGVVAEHAQYGQLSVDWLSDGIRNMVALAADIAHRCVRLNSHLGADAARKTSGIVLIDEVDMHLHPEWQQSVLEALATAFPHIQFVVTTHSPLVLSTVRKENIRLITSDGEVQPLPEDAGTFGAESVRVLEEIFGVHSRPQHLAIVHKLTRYLGLVENQQESTEEAQLLRGELEDALGKHDPELRIADTRISQLKELRRR